MKGALATLKATGAPDSQELSGEQTTKSAVERNLVVLAVGVQPNGRDNRGFLLGQVSLDVIIERLVYPVGPRCSVVGHEAVLGTHGAENLRQRTSGQALGLRRADQGARDRESTRIRVPGANSDQRIPSSSSIICPSKRQHVSS